LREVQTNLHFYAAVIALAGCGNVGQSPATSCSLCGTYNDLSGVASTSEGSLSALQGWVVAAFERDTGIARVETINNTSGKFKFKHLRTDQNQTLALLSPNYRIQAVLSIPAPESKAIRQWVKFKSPQIPKLINAGNIIQLESLDGIEVQNFSVPAQLQNLDLPTGVSKLGLTRPSQLTSQYMQNIQGRVSGGLGLLGSTAKSSSSDYNNNGVIKWLDPYDAEKDSTKLDLFAADESNGKQLFTQGVKYFSVQVTKTADENTKENLTQLTFTTQVLEGTEITPTVQMRGAEAVLGKSLVSLLDDGTGTRTYQTQIKLTSTATISAFDVIFLELKFGSDAKAWIMDFPWTFPLDLSALPASSDATAKSAWDSGNLIVTNPFSAKSSSDPLNSFFWNVRVYSDTTLIWTSQYKLFDASKTTANATISAPKSIFNFNNGTTYKYVVTLQSDDQIPGHPAYVIQSQRFTITAP